jgi:hypothetical protein
MKKIEHYLHFYLPVKVELNNAGSKVYNRTAVAVGNMDNEYKYVTLRMGEGVKAFTHSILFSEINRVKPILRPLSDMTENEAIWIANCILFHSYHGFVPKAEKYKDRYIVRGKGNPEGDKVELLFVGDFAWVVEGKMNTVPFEYSFDVIPYLLKQGFDLFGLIDEGLAANACDLKAGSIA